MKTRTLLITIGLLTVVIVLIASGSKKNISTDEAIKALSGTWVNPEYETSRHRGAQLIINPNGTIYLYKRTTSDWPGYEGYFDIDEAWKDREGNINCKLTATDFTFVYGLVRISNSRKILELIYSRTGYDDYPKEIDPNDGWYVIYYRQE